MSSCLLSEQDSSKGFIASCIEILHLQYMHSMQVMDEKGVCKKDQRGNSLWANVWNMVNVRNNYTAAILVFISLISDLSVNDIFVVEVQK